MSGINAVQNSIITFPKKCTDNIFEGLTFNELSASSRVCRKWRALADEARTAHAYAGMNAGFLYRITDTSLNSGYLYVSRANSLTRNVLSLNPLLRAAFNKAQVVAFNDLDMLAPEQKTAFFESMKEIPLRLKQRFSPERLASLNQKVWKTLEKALPPEKFGALKAQAVEMSVENQICMGILGAWSNKERSDPNSLLVEQAKAAHKAVMNLSADNARQNDSAASGKLILDWIKTDEGLDEFLYPFEHDPDALERMSTQYDQGWIHGHRKLFDETPWPHEEISLDSTDRDGSVHKNRQAYYQAWQECAAELMELKEKQLKECEAVSGNPQTRETALEQIGKKYEAETSRLMAKQEAMKKALEESNQKVEAHLQKLEKTRDRLKQMAERHEPLIHSMEKRGEQVAGRIAGLLEQSPLIVIGSNSSEAIEKLKERGIEVLGPLRAPLKPRGLLWKLTDPQGRIGYFAASIHITPAFLLNFNSAFARRFEESGVLGVEVDVTRQEVSEKMSKLRDQHSWEEIQSLSEEERDKLFILFKELITLPALQKMDDVPQERDPFLLWAIKHIGPYMCYEVGVGPGIDSKFVEMAKAQGKPVVDLESVDLHMEAGKEMGHSYFSHFGSREFLSVLAKMKPHKAQQLFDQMKAQFKAAVVDDSARMWEFGLVAELEQSAAAQKREPANQKMMIQRNHMIADTFDRLVSSGKVPFAVAGANHEAGAMSVLEFLRQYGYKDEQIVCEEPSVPALLKMASRI